MKTPREILQDATGENFTYVDYYKDGTPIDVSAEEPHAKVTLSLYPGLNDVQLAELESCLLYTSPSPRDQRGSRMPSSA